MFGSDTRLGKVLGLRSHPDFHLLPRILLTRDVLFLQLAVLAALHRRKHSTHADSDSGLRELQEVRHAGVLSIALLISGNEELQL
jgi:hypothetical protein